MSMPAQHQIPGSPLQQFLPVGIVAQHYGWRGWIYAGESAFRVQFVAPVIANPDQRQISFHGRLVVKHPYAGGSHQVPHHLGGTVASKARDPSSAVVVSKD